MRQDALAHRLRTVLGRLVRTLRAASPDTQPSWSQAAILSRLDRHGETTAAALAVAERMRPQSMGGALDALETSELIERSPDPDDRRQVRVRISARGREVLAAGRASRQDWLAQALTTRLSTAERAVLREAVGLLERLADE